MKPWKKALIPVVVLLVGIVGAFLIIKAKPTVERQPAQASPPLVRIVEATLETLSLDVTSQGTVVPRTEAALIPEVAGRIVQVSPSFAQGGFFRRGQTLVQLDSRDFQLAVTQAQAEVARAKVLVTREQAEAQVALGEWQELSPGAEPPPLVAREPQLAEARAAVAAAEANLARARLNLERTRLRAPFDGRVRSKQADVGQYVTPGQPLARIYAVDYAEVRLPVMDRELAFLDLPMSYRGSSRGTQNEGGPAVELTSTFAGERHRWQGWIVRTEGEIDPATRMLNLVARVEDPYGRPEGSSGNARPRPPLAVGLFVDAVIQGQQRPGLIRLPREALRSEDRVLVVEGTRAQEGEAEEARLRFRPVEVVRTTSDEAWISDGLAAGDSVVISPLETPVNGMRVRVLTEDGTEDNTQEGTEAQP